MADSASDIAAFVESVHPYDSLPRDELQRVIRRFEPRRLKGGSKIYALNEHLPGLFLIMDGSVEVRDSSDSLISQLFPRNTLGERGLLADGRAATNARALTDVLLLMLPAAEFTRLMSEHPVYSRFFTRGKSTEIRRSDLAFRKVTDLMSSPPIVCSPDDTVQEAARLMRSHRVSSLCIVKEGRLVGIITTGDLTARVLAEGLEPARTPISAVMTPAPVSLGEGALVSDVFNLMLERRIAHLPISEGERVIGMVTQTDLTRYQATSSASMVSELSRATSATEMSKITARIPHLLVQLVGGNHAHEVVTRLITDIADAATRRLILLAEAELGPPPVPYLWLACGSQGRQEQTGVSDQDNCIFIDDSFVESHREWFDRFARFVSDGLNTCGYVYCPGDMMATNRRWCQPVKVWREYFRHWIETPGPMAQMLASVMFDLRPIAGTAELFRDLQAETLERASRNSIFVAHMIGNSLKHAPPLGLLRGFATMRAGERRNQIDMKHNGVVPVNDLGRVYALMGRLTPVNTRARLLTAEEAAVISQSGARDLIAAYDLIAELRLRNQAAQVKAGARPDNYLGPYDLGEFERSHLRDAFVVVRTMQSALANGRAATF
ncbi:DUF294 nucleotidyltransferase-like domain-containing protein [Rhizobium halophilum]|uniref:DUF294 nucleotidyltransferase-like domain-containing protein n=1 Tax=Rhizobium halophilum TaxID=2846852 RepID=UPI001EFC2FD0|nr:DUF294 nucleotidyltransferase-like domain-containing protein [Rhizobium halophilum]MCF6370224.1 DUF294 nucleotidyltransferase-like domain-containing protein [Rhizobium halophilum]